MSIRGLSFKQLATMLLTENLAIVVFAVLLGTVVGLIIVYGNISATNTMSSSILTHHMVFPLDMVLTLFACFVLVFASTIIPVIVMSRRYVSRLERIVREA
jgi:ABC-type antimicrobial peptide transport system permease subunit